MGVDNSNSTKMELQKQQEDRMKQFVTRWKNVGRKSKCYVIGDLNFVDHATPTP